MASFSALLLLGLIAAFDTVMTVIFYLIGLRFWLISPAQHWAVFFLQYVLKDILC